MLRALRSGRAGYVRTLAALALLAMAMRALLPFGYMLSPAQNGRFVTITLCSSTSPSQARLNLSTGALESTHDASRDEAPRKRNHADAPCAFAAMAPLAPPSEGVDLANVRLSAPLSLMLRAPATPGRGLASPPPWSTGPPQAI